MKKDKNQQPVIVLTGGGTAGHVTPNLALIEPLQKKGFKVVYMGRGDSQEEELAKKAGLDYYPVKAGRFLRALSLKSFTEPFKNVAGYFQALSHLRKIRPSAVFAKGGFVSFPVVSAAWTLGIKSILHESDFTPGLANKLCDPFAKRVCTSFEQTLNYLPAKKSVYTGSPVRAELLQGDGAVGRRLCGFDTPERAALPVLMMMGGSTGARIINDTLREALPKLLKEFNVLHLCGKGNLAETYQNIPGYFQTEYAYDELKDYYAAADLMISRAGANAIMELLTLRKPALLIPLSGAVTRGDQILNAGEFERQGFSAVLEQENLNVDSLLMAVEKLWQNRNLYREAMAKSPASNGTEHVVAVIDEIAQANK